MQYGRQTKREINMINGFCDDSFLDAKSIFEDSINSGFELGGAICIEVKGKKYSIFGEGI